MSGWSKTFILLSGILYAFVGVYCFFQPIGALIDRIGMEHRISRTDKWYFWCYSLYTDSQGRARNLGTSGVLDGYYFRHVSTYF